MLRADNENLFERNLLRFVSLRQVFSAQVIRTLGNTESYQAASYARDHLLGQGIQAWIIDFGDFYRVQYVAGYRPVFRNNPMNAEPLIQINYICTTGLQGHFSYETVNMGRAGAAHINHFSGGLTYVHPTVALTGERMPVGLSHVYTSNHNRANGQQWGMRLGVGFRLSSFEEIKPLNYFESRGNDFYDFLNNLMRQQNLSAAERERLREWLTPRDYYILVDGTGAMHRFNQCIEDEALFLKETNPKIELRMRGNNIEISDEHGNVKIYAERRSAGTNFWGRPISGHYYRALTTIRDANGNETNIFYDNGRITRVVDTVGRTTTLHWNNNGYLTRIECPVGRSTRFAYDRNTFEVSVLASITYDDGQVTTFFYAQKIDRNRDAFHRTRLTAVSSPDDHHIVFELDAVHTQGTTSYRVASIQHGIAGTVEQEVVLRDRGNTDRSFWQRAFYIVSRLVFEVVQILFSPSWLRINEYGWWYFSFGPADDPMYGEEEIHQNFDFEEDVSTIQLTYNSSHTLVQNSLGEEAGVTYIFDRVGRAVGARDNTNGDTAFVVFTESDGVQNLPGFMAGTAIVHNLLCQNSWRGGISAAGEHTHRAWQVNPGNDLHQTATGLERGETYTISLFAKAQPGATARLYVNGHGEPLDLTDQWDRFTRTIEGVDRNSVQVSVQAQDGAILVEAIQLEQNGGASPFNHVQNSRFAQRETGWQITNRGSNDGYDRNRSEIVVRGQANANKALWQPIELSESAAGQMVLFGATASIASVRSEPYDARVAVRFFDTAGRVIALETEYDCVCRPGTTHTDDCEPTGNVRNNQVFAAFNRDVRHIAQTVAMAHVIPDGAVRMHLYISYDNQSSLAARHAGQQCICLYWRRRHHHELPGRPGVAGALKCRHGELYLERPERGKHYLPAARFSR